MKSILSVAVLSTLGAVGLPAGTAFAADYTDTAQVISATPVYERVSAPRRECVNEPVTTYDERRVRRDRNDSYRESRTYPDSREETRSTGAGAVLGAIIGGVIGHQFGNSTGGRDRGTIAGAVIGGMIGHGVESEGSRDESTRPTDSAYRRAGGRGGYDVERVPVAREVERCNVVNDNREEIRGYDVRYRYASRDYTTRLPYDPGPTLPVNVDVRPGYRGLGQTNPNRY